jgi:hypothetical protein
VIPFVLLNLTEKELVMNTPLNVRIPEKIINVLDERAKQLGWTRSQLVKEYLFLAVQNLKDQGIVVLEAKE